MTRSHRGPDSCSGPAVAEDAATRRTTAQPVENDLEYEVALEFQASLQACLRDSGGLGEGLDEETRADLVRGYQVHLQDVSDRIAEYEARRDGTSVTHAPKTVAAAK